MTDCNCTHRCCGEKHARYGRVLIQVDRCSASVYNIVIVGLSARGPEGKGEFYCRSKSNKQALFALSY